jgi:glycosyltransferase involved in cell wall biosynthesis
MRILFLAQLLPYPLDTGAKVRAYYVLRYLTQQHDVTLVTFSRAEDRPEFVEHLRSFCAAVHTVPMVRSRLHDAAALPTAVLRREPVVIARDRVPPMYALLRRLLNEGPFDAVHADQTSMVQYALWCADYVKRRYDQRPLRVLDAHNALYLVVKRMAQHTKKPAWRQFLTWEAQRLEHYERTTYGHFDRVIFVTGEDRARLQLDNAVVIPICADPAATAPVQRRNDAMNVTFVGALHWPPNAQGIAWFARESWLSIVDSIPEAQLTIIGKAPPPEVSVLALELPNVRVTGYVDDLQPYLADTGVFLVPLRAGGGMRVKIVDAWTWQLPVVATTIGAEGLSYKHGVNLLIADQPADLAKAVVQVLRDPTLADSLAHAGRCTAQAAYGWQTEYRKWNEVY